MEYPLNTLVGNRRSGWIHDLRPWAGNDRSGRTRNRPTWRLAQWGTAPSVDARAGRHRLRLRPSPRPHRNLTAKTSVRVRLDDAAALDVGSTGDKSGGRGPVVSRRHRTPSRDAGNRTDCRSRSPPNPNERWFRRYFLSGRGRETARRADPTITVERDLVRRKAHSRDRNVGPGSTSTDPAPADELPTRRAVASPRYRYWVADHHPGAAGGGVQSPVTG